MQTGITAIYEVDDLGSTPARVNRKTGELYINMKKWAQLTPDARLFVLLHEAGHVDQDTKSELLADNYAFHAYARAGKPLSKSIQALTRLLHFNNPQHYDRLRAQMARAFAYDYHVNGNMSANPDLMKGDIFQGFNNGYSDFTLITKRKRKAWENKLKKMLPPLPFQKKHAPPASAAAATSAQPAKPTPINEPVKSVAADPALPIPVTPGKTGLYIAGALIVLVIVTVVVYIKRRK